MNTFIIFTLYRAAGCRTCHPFSQIVKICSKTPLYCFIKNLYLTMSLWMDRKWCQKLPTCEYSSAYTMNWIIQKTAIYIVGFWQKLCAKRAIAVSLSLLWKWHVTGQENMFPHNFSVITNQNTPKALMPLLFLSVFVCVWVITFCVSATGFVTFLHFSCNFFFLADFLLCWAISEISLLCALKEYLEQVFISLSFIHWHGFSSSGSPLTEQMLSTISSCLDLKRHWTWCCLMLPKFSIHVNPALWVSGLRAI